MLSSMSGNGIAMGWPGLDTEGRFLIEKTKRRRVGGHRRTLDSEFHLIC